MPKLGGSNPQVSDLQQVLMHFEASSPIPTLTIGEIFDSADHKLISLLSEDRRLERKPPTVHCKELGEYISMWANTGPDGGLIAIGIEDRGVFVGLSQQGVRRWNDLEKTHETYVPDARIESKRITVENKKGESDFILLLRIHFSRDAVIFNSGNSAYLRVADTKKKLTPKEIFELQCDRGQIDREQAPSTLAWPVDFNTSSINKWCEAVKLAFRIEETASSKDILTQRRLGKLVDGSFIPNLACALIFAHDPLREVPGCKVHFLRFSGREELTGSQRNVVKDTWFEGNVPYLIQVSAEFVGSQLREFSALGPNGRFYSDPEYPADAWYEALVNAVVHRSYGGFPPTVTPANIYTTRYPRNPILMDSLLHFQYVKCSNEGAKRMRREMLDHRLPEPEFSEMEAAFCKVSVVLRNNIQNRQPWVASDRLQRAQNAVFANLTDEEKRIMAFVVENRSINVSEASRVAACSWKKARSVLERIANRGLLVHRIRKAAGKQRNVDTKAVFTLPA